MAGITGNILIINLSTGKNETLKKDESFYRMYPGGSSMGTWFILSEGVSKAEPLSPENILTISPGITTGTKVSGASRCCMTALSPLTGTIGDSQAGGSIGPMIKRAGLDALVVKGRADHPSYLFIEKGEAKILDAGSLSGKGVLEVYDILREKHGEKDLSLIQCGPAGEKLVRFANVIADTCDAFGRAGMGAVMGSKNLRAVVVRGGEGPEFSDPGSIKNLNRSASQRLPGSGFPETLSRYGTPGVLSFQANSGNLATMNYSRGYHEKHENLDGQNFEKDMGAGKSTCFGCIVGCRRRVKLDSPYSVSERLGGPEFETLGMLGSNLDICDAPAVAKANELCNNYGLDTITTGSVAGYIFESMEKGLITPDETGGMNFRFGDPESLFSLIEIIGEREGPGDIMAEGFEAMINHFGSATRPCAVHVKGEGLPVHMPQVKPSQSLVYAVCPIGPDHMSSEHDWLITSGSEAARGLGIHDLDTAGSTGSSKVRMTLRSQIYFSLLDSLCLCMFCWGPGNLFTYNELVDLVNWATGWEMTFWELMKAGERRIIMMKLVNEMRGFTSRDDKLPERLFNPLPDGPGKGKHVDREKLDAMKREYYSMMGWDPDSGMISRGKISELALEWIEEK